MRREGKMGLRGTDGRGEGREGRREGEEVSEVPSAFARAPIGSAFSLG